MTSLSLFSVAIADCSSSDNPGPPISDKEFAEARLLPEPPARLDPAALRSRRPDPEVLDPRHYVTDDGLHRRWPGGEVPYQISNTFDGDQRLSIAQVEGIGRSYIESSGRPTTPKRDIAQQEISPCS